MRAESKTESEAESRTESRTKTFFMTLGLATFIGVGAACFGLLRTDPPPADAPCDEATGQAKADCEAQS